MADRDALKPEHFKACVDFAREIMYNDALDRVFIAIDYFDASINKISAWVTGVRSTQISLLNALLQPVIFLLQNEGWLTEPMVFQEELGE